MTTRPDLTAAREWNACVEVLADDIRKAVEGWSPRCQYVMVNGQTCDDWEDAAWHRDAKPTDHLDAAHPFQHDPALDKSPEALLVRLLDVITEGERLDPRPRRPVREGERP